MTGKKTAAALAAVVILAAFAWPAAAQTSLGKVKVSVENASLRDKPSLDAEIIEDNIPLGTIFNVEKKSGEFYEVKFQSKLGVVITGYIHEMYVEALAAEPAPKPVEPKAEPVKPEAPKPQAPPAAARLPLGGGPKFEIGLGFGLGIGSFLPETSSYGYEWGPWYSLEYVQEQGNFSHKVKGPLGLGFSLAYYFSGGLGVKFRVDMNFKQSMDSSQSGYVMTFKWDRPVNPGPFERTNTWPVNGDMSVMPISLDVVYKFVTEGMFQPYVNAGLSLFTGKANFDTFTGYGLSWIDWGIGMQYIDYVAVPMRIEGESLGSFGGNVGLGADIFFSPSIGLFIDATYFIGGSKEIEWFPVPGEYPTILHEGWTATIPADALAIITENLAPLKVSTSFFKILFGLKVGL